MFTSLLFSLVTLVYSNLQKWITLHYYTRSKNMQGTGNKDSGAIKEICFQGARSTDVVLLQVSVFVPEESLRYVL